MNKRNKVQKIFFVPDAHVPYHDNKAFKLVLKAIKKFAPDTLVVLGDFADFYSVSSHDKSPDRRILLNDELKAVRKALSSLERLNVPRKIFISGNHENRLERYITTKSPELFGLVTIPELFKLEENDWEYVPYKKHVMLGRLAISHDYGSAGQSAHRTAATKLGSSVVIGHTHRSAMFARNTVDGKLMMSAMFGWLGDLTQIDYMHQASVTPDWITGFGVGYMLQDGTVVLNSIPIVNNSCILEGEIIK